MDIEKLEQIKRIAIIALFSDDDLMDSLVLKGGNALDIVYRVAQRSSLDLDFSTDKGFDKAEIPVIKNKMEKVLKETFREHGYKVFDISLTEVPEASSTPQPEFWGGYVLQFKVIEATKYNELQNNPRSLRVNAIEVSPNHKRILKVSISKFEYCVPKTESELDYYTIYVYTPEMIVFEKLRAICQQMPEYTPNSTKTARARDFFDIYTVMKHFKINLTSPRNDDLLRKIFDAKKVPLSLIGKITQYREYHRPDFASVEATAKPKTRLKTFDFYFDYVMNKCKALQTLWEV